MAASNATIIAYKNQPYRIYFSWRDTSGNLITGIAGAATQVYIDGAQGVVGPVPVEMNNSSASPGGACYMDLTAAQMNAFGTMIVATCSNANSTAAIFVVTTSGVYTVTGNETRPSVNDPFAMQRWVFRYLYNLCNLARGTGIFEIGNDDSTVMTAFSIVGTDTYFNRSKSNP